MRTIIQRFMLLLLVGCALTFVPIAQTQARARDFNSMAGDHPVSTAAAPNHENRVSSPPSGGSWHLVWADEFNNTTLDGTKWTPNLWGGVANAGNNEQEMYVPDAVTTSNGQLHLQAKQQSAGGYNYTSGVINSYGKFGLQYGYFEMRAKLPRGKGFWPAFWLFPVSSVGPNEIDVLESLGDQPRTVYMTNHWADATGASVQYQAAYTGADFSQNFHTFGVAWTSTGLIYYIDGVVRARSTQGMPAEPMYIIVDLAVGGNWPGNPDATTPFPSSFDVDYIRVYQQQ